MYDIECKKRARFWWRYKIQNTKIEKAYLDMYQSYIYYYTRPYIFGFQVDIQNNAAKVSYSSYESVSVGNDSEQCNPVTMSTANWF